MTNFVATGGVNTFTGAPGELDTFTFTAGTANSGDKFDGFDQTDAIVIAAGEMVDFTAVGRNFFSIEELRLAGSTAIFASTQLDGNAGGLPLALAVAGDGLDSSADTIRIDMATGALLNLSQWTFSHWNASQDRIRIFDTAAGNETITGSSADDTVTVTGGSDKVTLSAGTSDDELVIDYGSSTLSITNTAANAIGDGGSNHVEFSGVQRFTIKTGSGDDNIVAGSGDNSITGGAGNDTIDGRGGSNDTAVYFGGWKDYTIALAGTQTIVTDGRGGPHADGTDGVSNVEKFKFSNGTFTAAQVFNDAPTDISLSSATVADGAHSGATVGTLSWDDADIPLGDNPTYTVLGTSPFAIVAGTNTLVLAGPAGSVYHHDTTPTLTASIRVTDVHGASFDKDFVITVIAASNQPPTAVRIFDDAGNPITTTTVAENTATASHVKVGGIAVIDDGAGTNGLSLTGADKSFFEIVGTLLYLKAGTHLDFESKASYKVAVTAFDTGTGGSVTSATYTLKVGNVSPETVNGTSGDDSLVGGSDRDIISGGLGRDVLTGAGNADVFDFDTAGDSSKKSAKSDLITDFGHAIDRIDLSTIDANGSKAGDRAFKLLKHEGAHFTGKAGQLLYDQIDKKGTDHDTTVVKGDIDGNGKADFAISFTGLIDFSKADFVL